MLSILIPCKEEPNIVNFITEVEELFPYAQIIIANDRDGRGKGWAMRQALSQATGNIICFIDGDGDINPRMIYRLLHFIKTADVVVGKKELPTIFSRKIITILSRFYIRAMFGIKIDSQTGIKLFKREALPDWKCNSFAFDIEILYKCKNKLMIDVPIEANIRKSMRLKSIIECFIESLKIKLNRLPEINQ